MIMIDIKSAKYTVTTIALIFFSLFLAFASGPEGAMAQDETPPAEAYEVENAPVQMEDTPVPVEGAPVIDIWYGPDQAFGEIGTTQGWVNILGNVSDLDGIGALVYALNDGPEQAASIGPDGKRLSFRGDFNLDIRREELLEGKNEVLITATDILGNQASKTVRFTFQTKNIWPYPYEIVWSQTANIQDVAQVVDGKWAINPEGLRTAEGGYDRLVALGDFVWTDYEVVVPITIHRVQKQNDNGQPPAIGMILRWTGHTEDKDFEGEQPKTAWNRDSAIAWWHWEKTTKLEFNKGEFELFEPRIGVPYMFKARVALEPGLGTQYHVKVWPASQPEPADWNLTHQGKSTAPKSGSLLLLAHHVDATFGDISITGLAPLPTPTPLPTNTPTVTPTPTITNTPLPTNTATTTPTPPASGSAIIASSDPDAKGTPGTTVNPKVTSTSSFNSNQMYGLAFVILIVLLLGLAVARRQLMS